MKARVKFRNIETLPMAMTLYGTVADFRELRKLVLESPPTAQSHAPLQEFIRELGDLLERADAFFQQDMTTTGWAQTLVDADRVDEGNTE